ncbi:MAG TPA: exosortase/archaeosortase family protein [Verrucomicrobiae bacterium]|nr:exosortase/archaeosortase family protein [Verrucomicrobiae bacterium]
MRTKEARRSVDLADADGASRVALPSDAGERRRWAMGAVGLALFFYAYFVARTCASGVHPLSLFGWLWVYWGRGSDYAHGYVVPVIAAGLFVWKWRNGLHRVPLGTANCGLAVILAAVVMYWAGVKAANARLVAASFVVLVFGLVLYLAGWAWAKEVWFPCAFLFFMIPLNFLDAYVSFPLRLFVAHISTVVLNLIGVQVYQEGTGIYSKLNRFMPLEVADPCSGIRSLVALVALTSLYGYVTMSGAWKKWVLFASSIPLAVVGNLARITTVALVAQGFGQDLAMKVYHDYSGYIVFSLAILCMIGLGAVLNVNYQDMLHHWTREDVRPLRPVRATKKR